MVSATVTVKPSVIRARVDVKSPHGTGPERPDPAHVRRILAAYDSATAEQLAAGASWYADCRAICQSIADDTNIPLTIVVAVLAHTSANMGIDDNINATRLVCEAYRDNPAASLPSVHTPDVMGKVDLALRDSDITTLEFTRTVKGTRTRSQKVRSFFRCVLGDPTYVAIDIWATRVAVGSNAPNRQPDSRAYRRIENAYRVAAAKRDVDPAVMQATAWIVARGKAW